MGNCIWSWPDSYLLTVCEFSGLQGFLGSADEGEATLVGACSMTPTYLSGLPRENKYVVRGLN